MWRQRWTATLLLVATGAFRVVRVMLRVVASCVSFGTLCGGVEMAWNVAGVAEGNCKQCFGSSPRALSRRRRGARARTGSCTDAITAEERERAPAPARPERARREATGAAAAAAERQLAM